VQDDKTVKEQIVESAVDHQAGVLVAGLHGRKGPKA